MFSDGTLRSLRSYYKKQAVGESWSSHFRRTTSFHKLYPFLLNKISELGSLNNKTVLWFAFLAQYDLLASSIIYYHVMSSCRIFLAQLMCFKFKTYAIFIILICQMYFSVLYFLIMDRYPLVKGKILLVSPLFVILCSLKILRRMTLTLRNIFKRDSFRLQRTTEFSKRKYKLRKE